MQPRPTEKDGSRGCGGEGAAIVTDRGTEISGSQEPQREDPIRRPDAGGRGPSRNGGKRTRLQRTRKTEGTTPPPGEGLDVAGRRPPGPEGGLRGAGPTAGPCLHGQGHVGRRRAPFPGRATAPSHGPRTSPASRLRGEVSRAGPGLAASASCPCAQGPVLPTAAARVPGVSGLTVRECLLPLSEPRVRGQSYLYQVRVQGPNSALPPPTSGSFPGTPA